MGYLLFLRSAQNDCVHTNRTYCRNFQQFAFDFSYLSLQTHYIFLGAFIVCMLDFPARTIPSL